jgi:type I restriction enzyme S subunit
MSPDVVPIADAAIPGDDKRRWDLPGGWAWSSLAEVAAINPSTDFGGLSDDTEIPFIPMAAVAEETGAIDTSQRRPITAVRKGYVRFCEGDVIFAKITPCMENGKTAPVRGIEGGYAAGSTEFHVFRPKCVDTRYLWYWLVRRAFRIEAERSMSGSAGQLRVPIGYLCSAPVPLPPLPEQRRIVARIDELFAEIDEGEAALERARQGLDTSRRALLKAAVTGELTRDWREANRPAETGADLLARIRAEREASNAHQLRRRRPTVAAPLDISTLPELPRGWVWAPLVELSRSSSYGTSVKCSYEASGTVVLRIPNIREGRVSLLDIKKATESLDKGADEFLSPGDLLIVRTNGSEDLIGRAAVVTEPLGIGSYFASYLIRFRLAGDEVLWRWIGYVLNSPTVRQWMSRNIASSAGQYNVSQTALAGMPLPVPPPSEMAVLSESIQDQLEGAHDSDLALGQERTNGLALRQSILKAAFEGRLMPQDPADEPASVLLARLHDSNHQTATSRRRARTKEPFSHPSLPGLSPQSLDRRVEPAGDD